MLNRVYQQQIHHLTGIGALHSTFWDMLFALILFVHCFGMASRGLRLKINPIL